MSCSDCKIFNTICQLWSLNHHLFTLNHSFIVHLIESQYTSHFTGQRMTQFLTMSSLARQQQVAFYSATLADVHQPLAADSAVQNANRLGRMAMRLGNSTLGKYVHRLAIDYANSLWDIALGAKQRPIKAIAYTAALGALILTCKSNPNELGLRARLAELRQQMALIPASIHSRRADGCLERYTALLNGNRLELLDFWLFTLLVERPFDKRSNFYAAKDGTTREWAWTELRANCLDVGAFGRFWALEASFKDCDVREEEFTHNK